MVYPGEDCKFTIYEDEGNNYNFEKRCLCKQQKLTWDDKTGNSELLAGVREVIREWKKFLRD